MSRFHLSPEGRPLFKNYDVYDGLQGNEFGPVGGDFGWGSIVQVGVRFAVKARSPGDDTSD